MKNHYLDQRIRIKKPNLSLTEKKISDYFVHSESLLTQLISPEILIISRLFKTSIA